MVPKAPQPRLMLRPVSLGPQVWFADRVLLCLALTHRMNDQAPRFCLRQPPPSQRCDGALAAHYLHECRFWCARNGASRCIAVAYRQFAMQVTGSLHLVGDFLRVLRPRQ